MICSLCLKEILEETDAITVDNNIRHNDCHIEFEQEINELAKIYEETCEQDI